MQGHPGAGRTGAYRGMTKDESTPGPDQRPQDGGGRSLGPLQVAGSVLAAAFGVQSSKNRERDFKEGRFLPWLLWRRPANRRHLDVAAGRLSSMNILVDRFGGRGVYQDST